MISSREVADRERRATLWSRVFVVVVLLFMLGNTAAVTLLAVQDNRRIQQNKNIQKIIRDCVEPGRPCYEDNRQQRAKTVRDINRHSILAAACAVVIPLDEPVDARAEAIAACIRDQLDR